MAQVLLTTAAEESRIQVWRHVAEDSPDAADRLLERIDEKCRLYAHSLKWAARVQIWGGKCGVSSSATMWSFTVRSRTASSSCLSSTAHANPAIFRDIFRRV
jgi:hypothetical protein